MLQYASVFVTDSVFLPKMSIYGGLGICYGFCWTLSKVFVHSSGQTAPPENMLRDDTDASDSNCEIVCVDQPDDVDDLEHLFDQSIFDSITQSNHCDGQEHYPINRGTGETNLHNFLNNID